MSRGTPGGVDQFFGLPQDPRCFYYRTFQTAVDKESHLYEFVVPMVPPAWNDRDRVQHHRARIAGGAVPTAVAVTKLDRCQPATTRPVPDQHEHWGLTHFLLDGHHKFEAAAEVGAPLLLLSLVAIDDSLATSHDVARLPELRDRPRSARPASAAP
ncbi:MAG: hypothetical protein L0G99_05785 [Propionibacteriales bacterium]|nr:hypothetical protein [Propionibacteriales bacterium]